MGIDEYNTRIYRGAAPAIVPLIGAPYDPAGVLAFQTPATPIMEGIIDLHHDIMAFLVFIVVLVMYLLACTIVIFNGEVVKSFG